MRQGDHSGQASLLVVAGMAAALLLAFVLGGVARGVGVRGEAQRTADIAALAGAREMLAAYPRLFGGRHAMSRADYLAAARAAADRAARAKGAARIEVAFPDAETIAPVRIRVRVVDVVVARRGEERASIEVAAEATAEIAPAAAAAGMAAGGGYSGPLVQRQGKPMRPDVASAFDRMAAAARRDGVHLIVTSAFRSDAEQAVLFARNPDPRWVAPPGKSLHRYGTELDLGPASAYRWLAANAPRFRFRQRYAWEPWHFGFELNARSAPEAHEDGSRAVPDFVPAAFAAPIARAAQRWNVSAALLAAQLYAESNFNPFAVSHAGARGIAQFMPTTARAYGLRNPFDADRAIDAQAHLMRDLLREFAAVPLALAAYNAGPARVRACHCVPPIPETTGYVARILGLMGGAGEATGGGLAVRLVA